MFSVAWCCTIILSYLHGHLSYCKPFYVQDFDRTEQIGATGDAITVE